MPKKWSSSRREFLQGTVAAAGSSSVVAAFQHFVGRSSVEAAAGSTRQPPVLAAVADESTSLPLLKLPEGFRYISFGWTGDELTGGGPTPSSHDGMAVIASHDGVLTLCRNHEVSSAGPAFSSDATTYDPQAGGGCTLLKFDANNGQWLSSEPGIGGTVKNCAGGPTPWGSWLTCEETVVGVGDEDGGKPLKHERDHGWIFEVPADRPADPVPLKDMGRFVHEAVAIDPKTGIVYETEDKNTAGFYRFLPNEPGRLAAGGRLQMMKVRGARDLRGGNPLGRTWDTEWVDIEHPQRRHTPGKTDSNGVHSQGKEQGGTTFARLEGCWYGDKRIHLVSTSGGKEKSGQVYEYYPAEEQLRLIFESPGKDVLDSPDNITVTPGGGVLLCEDGTVVPHRLHGLTQQDGLFAIAANNIRLNGQRNGLKGDFRAEEWAGVCFSPDGRWLFVNIQTPGITFAITGPWDDLGL